jgi:hypothetical protein
VQLGLTYQRGANGVEGGGGWDGGLRSAFVADEASRQGQLFAQRGSATQQQAAAASAASRLLVAEVSFKDPV